MWSYCNWNFVEHSHIYLYQSMNLFRMTLKLLKRHFLEHFSQNLSNISVYKYWKKYSISLLSRELPILDIDTFPLSLSINWRYSLDEYWLPWSRMYNKIYMGKLTIFTYYQLTRWIIIVQRQVTNLKFFWFYVSNNSWLYHT